MSVVAFGPGTGHEPRKVHRGATVLGQAVYDPEWEGWRFVSLMDVIVVEGTYDSLADLGVQVGLACKQAERLRKA